MLILETRAGMARIFRNIYPIRIPDNMTIITPNMPLKLKQFLFYKWLFFMWIFLMCLGYSFPDKYLLMCRTWELLCKSLPR